MSKAKPAPNASVVIPVYPVEESGWEACRAGLSEAARAYADATGFAPAGEKLLLLPGGDGRPECVLFGTGNDARLARQPLLLGRLATELPAGTYRLIGAVDRPTLSYTGFLLGGYRFDRFREVTRPQPDLLPPDGADAAEAGRIAAAIINSRDLINRPANDLTTTALAEASRHLAGQHGATIREIVGDDLLAEGFPLVHAVGRAGSHPPRLIDFTWGQANAPKVTLVGKGVVFDTGGLNLKPDNSMLLMRKDMGGAATALAAASIIMASGVPVRLRVILSIVENAVASPAFRPGDIYRSRKGLSIEIGNTDAEGRLILADALALADEEAPEILLDFATLTGAARVALGPDLPPVFTTSDALAAEIVAAGDAVADPVWRLPLWAPYRKMLDSKFADMNNVGSGGFAGSITAALFLKQFVTRTDNYAHFDIYGWVPSAKPAQPEGGEPQVARLVAEMIARRYRSV